MALKLCVSWLLLCLVIEFGHCLPGCGQPGGDNNAGFPTVSFNSYPNAKRDESVHDTYAQCTVINDPYRWLEDPDSEETKKFVEAENAITIPYLEKNPFHADINNRCKELYSYQKYTGPFQFGKKFYSYQNTGSQEQDVLFVHDSYDSEGQIFVDPNTLSNDGSISLDPLTGDISHDGLIVAYGLTMSGSDWVTVQFKHAEKGDIYKNEKLEKLKFADVWWTFDNKGVFYGAMLDHKGKADGSENGATTNQKYYYHVLGTDQSKDIVAVEFPNNPDAIIQTYLSNCGRYFIAGPRAGTENNLVYVADLEKINYQIKTKLELIPMVTKMEANYEYVTNNDRIFIFLTNQGADNYRLVAIDLDNPDSKCWQTLVPENEKSVLQWAKPAYNYLVLCYTEDVKSVLQLHDIKTGKMIKKFDLEPGTVEKEYFSGKRGFKDMFFRLESFLTPGVIHHCDLSKPCFDLEVLKELKVENLDRKEFTVEQVFFKSKDGTKVPMHIFYRKELQKNSNNPCFLYGYGGYGDSVFPKFKPERVTFADNFYGVVAIANTRGGGEYGESWHRAGQLDKKQNCFDDFQAAAEYLIAQKYTNNKMLTINGRSNGGILMGACLNQRPDLFAAVVANVGILDMLRFQKFTIGKAWVVEFGSSDNEKDFQYLVKYSPLHNVKLLDDTDKQYPAVFLTTSDHDDRVPPLHTLKFVATLQFAAKSHPNQKNPFLVKIDTKCGHAKGASTKLLIDRATDMLCFISNALGIKFQIKSQN